jgi:hypothetical protein
MWNRDQVIQEIEQGSKEIRRLRENISAQPGSGFAARMQYGRLLDAALAQRSQDCVAELLQRLRDVCVASRCNQTVGDRMILNASFLVDRRREAAFDQRVTEIAADFDEMTFKFTGPWPPYNFVAIRLKQERAG